MKTEYIKSTLKILLFWSLFAVAGFVGKEFGLSEKSKEATKCTNQLFEKTFIALN